MGLIIDDPPFPKGKPLHHGIPILQGGSIRSVAGLKKTAGASKVPGLGFQKATEKGPVCTVARWAMLSIWQMDLVQQSGDETSFLKIT